MTDGMNVSILGILDPRTRGLFYLVAAILFYFALKAMSSPRSARRGNAVGALGMLLAVVVTLMATGLNWWWIAIGLGIGAAVGAFLATTVKMTAMPQMVAMFNGFGGLASALVALATMWLIDRPLEPGVRALMPPATDFGTAGFMIAAGLSVLIGWVTFTGSVVAFAKLQDLMPSAPITFPVQKVVNFALLLVALVCVGLLVMYPEHRWLIIPVAVIAAVLGVLFVIPIGGADMPVVISLLNSYSGLAAAATGFVIANTGLIIAGALVGASGIILTRLMCIAMNRSLTNVLFAAVGSTTSGPAGDRPPVKSYSAEDAAMVLDSAARVVIVPGYGMAVAQAQHAVKELTDILEARGTQVHFGIHPVAGRMPGHMNVLLAEAEVDYDSLRDLEQVNPEFEQTDAVLIIGANDVVNPAARTDKGSPIYGMPILDVDKSRTVMIIKRSLSPGFAGVDNPLFYEDKTMMLFGDGKGMVTQIVQAMKD